MAAPIRRRSGFTLIEIMMVVIILGVLATVVIGMFGNTSSDASESALKDDLRSIRGALQIYYAQHGTYPALATFETQMTQYSDTNGTTSATPSSAYHYGPYMISMPALPLGQNHGQTTVTGATYADGFGWQYDPTSGDFRANCTDTENDGQGNYYHTF